MGAGKAREEFSPNEQLRATASAEEVARQVAVLSSVAHARSLRADRQGDRVLATRAEVRCDQAQSGGRSRGG